MAQIVVIESEQSVRIIVTKILESAGHSVRAAGKFHEAVILLHSIFTELVITEALLSDVAGDEAMLLLRQDFPHLLVLMICGLPDQKSIAAWKGDSRFAICPKPFTCGLLTQKVQQMLAAPKSS